MVAGKPDVTAVVVHEFACEHDCPGCDGVPGVLVPEVLELGALELAGDVTVAEPPPVDDSSTASVEPAPVEPAPLPLASLEDGVISDALVPESVPEPGSVLPEGGVIDEVVDGPDDPSVPCTADPAVCDELHAANSAATETTAPTASE